jgi:hypothetical protein
MAIWSGDEHRRQKRAAFARIAEAKEAESGVKTFTQPQGRRAKDEL